ncbi:Uncharacterised protein [Chlamydia trachomatis]|nr:Uncharacterised protein [Chlamydia trachomatis]
MNKWSYAHFIYTFLFIAFCVLIAISVRLVMYENMFNKVLFPWIASIIYGIGMFLFISTTFK